MKTYVLLLLSCLVAATTLHAQNYNLELLSQVDFPDNEIGNDVWGYVDANGIEYAVIGSRAATYIYSLEDPRSPQLRKRIPGARSIWRDMKSHGSYIYVVADQGQDGLLVVDMSAAPETIDYSFYKPIIEAAGSEQVLKTIHNLYITPEGYMILAGSNISLGSSNQSAGAPLVFDLNASATEPPYIGHSRDVYAHDVYAAHGLLYTSDIYTGELSIHDFTDPANPRLLGAHTTTTDFTHNAWSKEDESAVFTTDEKEGAFVDAYDVRDPTSPRLLDVFRPERSWTGRSIPHNTHVLNNHLITSWYKDGVVITDATRPHNMIETGIYDTYPGSGGGFGGCWGAYPFLPSGLLLASDMESGLYVFQPTYEQGCYYEGVVLDSITRQPVVGALLDFDGRPAQQDHSDIDGSFATGIYAEGTYPVVFSAPGYQIDTVQVDMKRGVVNLDTILLQPLPRADMKLSILSAETQQPVSGTIHVYIQQLDAQREELAYREIFEYRQNAASPDTVISLPLGNYQITLGSWGYLTHSDPFSVREGGADRNVYLLATYYDDFTFDYGWQISGDASKGQWEIGVPEEVQFGNTITQPAGSRGGIDSNRVASTGLLAGDAVGTHDVDNGSTILTSPPFNFTNVAEPGIQLFYFFYNGGGNSTPNDYLTLELSNGDTTILLDRITESTTDLTAYKSGSLSGRIPFTDSMRLIVTAADRSPGHLVEAQVDDFLVYSAERPPLRFSDTSGCAPFTMSVDLPEDVDLVPEWILAGADNIELSGSGATATYNRAGTYDIVFRIPDEYGTPTDYVYERAITVLDTPDASFTVGEDPTLKVTFTSHGDPAATYLWNFGDGTTSSEKNPVHEYGEAGFYTVSLTVTNDCGSASQETEILLQTVGTIDLPDGTVIKLLDNPVSNMLRIQYSGARTIPYQLVAGGGQVVRRGKLYGGQQTGVETGDLPAGLYFLAITQEQTYSLPVIIQHD